VKQFEMLKPYKRAMTAAYAPGMYVTRELLRSRPEVVRAVYAHPKCDAPDEAARLCRAHGIPFRVGERYFRLINRKENTYMLAEFEKYDAPLAEECPHIALVDAEDAGNLGAMLRTALACGLRNVALVSPAADVFHPRAIRASRGAAFWLNIQSFPSIDDYRNAHPRHALYPFMLGAGCAPDAVARPAGRRFTLIFGSESSGLSPAFAEMGEVITIPQTAQVDSLNVAVAMGIGTFLFARENGLL
jgi:TrmH family RNA methyltransferase